jgi:hypothetical protein
MRKLVPLVVVAMIMALAAPASAKRVVNESYSQTEIQAWWGIDEGTWLGAWAWDSTAGSGMGFQYSEGFDCEDPGNVEGLANLWIDAGGEWDTFDVVTKGRDKYTFGTAAGWVSGWGHIDYCDGAGDDFEFDSWVSMEMAGDGPLIRESGTSSFHIPGDVNINGRSSSTYRFGSGWVYVGGFGDGETFAADGRIGEATWGGHQNCKRTCPEFPEG